MTCVFEYHMWPLQCYYSQFVFSHKANSMTDAWPHRWPSVPSPSSSSPSFFNCSSSFRSLMKSESAWVKHTWNCCSDYCSRVGAGAPPRRCAVSKTQLRTTCTESLRRRTCQQKLLTSSSKEVGCAVSNWARLSSMQPFVAAYEKNIVSKSSHSSFLIEPFTMQFETRTVMKRKKAGANKQETSTNHQFTQVNKKASKCRRWLKMKCKNA